MTRTMQVETPEAWMIPPISALSPGMTDGTIWFWKAKAPVQWRGDFANDAYAVLAYLTGSTAEDDTATTNTVQEPSTIGLTPAGGLYARWSRTSPATGNQSTSIASNSVRDYLKANPDHRYFLGWLGRQLDLSPDPSNASNSARILGPINNVSSPIATIMRNSDNIIAGEPESRRTPVRRSVSADGTGWKSVYAAFTDLGTGTVGDSNVVMLHHNGGAGSPAPSYVSYMSMIIDLTAADMTDAEAAAVWDAADARFRPRWMNDELPPAP